MPKNDDEELKRLTVAEEASLPYLSMGAVQDEACSALDHIGSADPHLDSVADTFCPISHLYGVQPSYSTTAKTGLMYHV